MTGSISSNPRQQASLFQPYISEKLYPHLRIISTADNGANPDVWTVIVIEGIRQAIVADWPALLSVFFVNSYLTSEVVGVSATKIIRYSWNAAVRASAKRTLDCVLAWGDWLPPRPFAHQIAHAGHSRRCRLAAPRANRNPQAQSHRESPVGCGRRWATWLDQDPHPTVNCWSFSGGARR